MTDTQVNVDQPVVEFDDHNCGQEGKFIEVIENGETIQQWKCGVCNEKYISREIAVQITADS